MTQENIKATYRQRADAFEQRNAALNDKDKGLSLIRIILFVATLIGFVYFANIRAGAALWMLLLVFVVSFPLLVRYHNKLRAQRKLYTDLKQINLHEIKRMQDDLKGFDPGYAYADPVHPYTGDLDIFGEHSLFQLLNRSHTAGGKRQLAGWLSQGADRAQIIRRQQAVQELAADIDWRQRFQAYGMESKGKEEDTETLLAWIREPAAVLQNNIYLAASRIMPMVTIAAIIAYYWLDIPGIVPLTALAANGLILWRTAALASDTHQKTSRGVGALKAYLGMIQTVEDRTFEQAMNRDLRQSLSHTGMVASQEIRKLRYILDNFDARGNMLYHIPNIILLLDVYWLLKADRWKKNISVDIAHWFEAIHQFEALISLAGFAYANPDYTFPEISTEKHTFAAQALGHCLIGRKKRVSNDFAMEGRGTILVITGSNMSGKSTFLRTVGINAVLALAGAPVCARSMTVSEMQVFTSMRTQDSLEESVSSFYAELRRLRQLLESLKVPEKPVLFMLDEILKGTNSQDRHHGAASLIRQLSKLHASGFVSTHDLALGDMAEELPGVKNYNFTSTIEEDEIYFDYKLHEGICQSFNASKLMAKMGIAVDE